jgi:hypothetical protein
LNIAPTVGDGVLQISVTAIDRRERLSLWNCVGVEWHTTAELLKMFGIEST